MTVGGIIDQKLREEHLVKFSSGIVFTSGSTKATSLRAAAIHFNNNKRNAKIKKNKTISCQLIIPSAMINDANVLVIIQNVTLIVTR